MIDAMQDKKAEEITVLDVQSLTSFTDYFVICTGESEPQLRTIAKHVDEKLSATGIHAHHLEGRSENGWILMDYDDFVIHIFSREKRSFYNLERLWADAQSFQVSHGVSVPASR